MHLLTIFASTEGIFLSWLGNSYRPLLSALDQAGKRAVRLIRHLAAEQFVENQAKRK